MTVFASDRALLDAFRRGDGAALTTVYFHYIDELAAARPSGDIATRRASSAPK